MSSFLKEEKTEKFLISFIWIKEAEKTFTWLKTVFITVFILMYYNLKLSIWIETDALKTAVLKALSHLKCLLFKEECICRVQLWDLW